MPQNKGCIPWNKGSKVSEELRIKISIATKKAMAKLSPEKRALLSPKGEHRSPATEFKKGRIVSQQERLEISQRAKRLGFGKWMKGRIPAFLEQGKHYHPSGENNPNWKGGITPIHSEARHSDEYKKWRRDVFIRDHYTCQKCGHRFVGIVAHHIKSFAEYKDLWFDVNNGQTLCRSCHCKLHKPKRTKNYLYDRKRT